MSRRLVQIPLLPGHLHVVRAARKPPPAGMRQRSGKRSPLWYAVSMPQLLGATEDTGARLLRAARLNEIAELLSNLSATVSIEEPDCLLFEVRSSLRYFGGIEKIRSHLHSMLAPQLLAWGLPEGFHQAASPTPAASLLLARTGYNLLVYRTDNLRSALGRLSVQALPLAEDKRKRLHNTGLRTLRDIWRLPVPALAQRFGPDFVKQLERCLGQVATPLKTWHSTPLFNVAQEFDYPVENTGMLLHSIEDMLGTLVDFLRRRELAATHLTLALQHERQEDTVLHLDLRQPTRQQAHLLLLLETRIDTLALPSPVIGMILEVRHFAPFSATREPLRGIVPVQGSEEKVCAADIIPLLEQLQARLGNDAVRAITCVEKHCPEQAGQDRMFTGGIRSNPPAPDTASRPYWLLPEPLALEQSEGRLYYRSSISLVSGPERIETGWWTGQDVRRDYYVARNRQGMRLWIFHDRRGERQWYLHGIFD